MRPGVAFYAGQLRVHTNRGEDRLGVLELALDTFLPIVAGATIRRVLAEMKHHKRPLQPQVTVGAVGRFKDFIPAHMASLAGKGRTLGQLRVRCRGKTQQLVGEFIQRDICQ